MDFTAKYRPRKFSEVVGQSNVVNVLKSQRDLQVLLFYGASGVGKTTLARIYAAHVCCERGNVDECDMECEACKAIFSGQSFDLLEENVGDSRGIDDMRRITEWINLRPMFLSKRVLILDEVHALTRQAQNLLLKVLEEPPKHALIMLCTTNALDLIEPLRQRCFAFELKKVSNDDLVTLLVRVLLNERRERKFEVTDTDRLFGDVMKIVEESDGTPRKALRKLQVYLDGGVLSEVDDEEVRFYDLFNEIVYHGLSTDLRNKIYEIAQEEDVGKISRLFESYVRKKVLMENSIVSMVAWFELLKQFYEFQSESLYASDRVKIFWKLIGVGIKAVELRKVLRGIGNEVDDLSRDSVE